MAKFIEGGQRFSLDTPSLLPSAAGYLWNKKMMIHMNCQGYAVAQYMDPEPRKYAHAPTMTATSFMQPEQPYYAHHPGRFFYIQDCQSNALFSVPFAPVKKRLDRFEFKPGKSDIQWRCEQEDLLINITLTLATELTAEFWTVEVTNQRPQAAVLKLTPYFPVGYMSWMNMGAHYDERLNAVVATSITPYQKLEDYEKNKHLKDITYLACDVAPSSFETSQLRFEGQGGLHEPDALVGNEVLSNQDNHYEMPACVMQFDLELKAGKTEVFHFVFGPAKNKQEIAAVIEQGFGEAKAANASQYQAYVESGQGVIHASTPDEQFDHFINHWLPRQVFYHGDTHRLTTDPQTRNYLQDGMGMAYVDSQVTKNVILTALGQQNSDGEMPDGVLLSSEATLKYINQIPHTDHSVWLAIILDAYLNETNDWAILDQRVGWHDCDEMSTVLEHMNRAMDHMCQARDQRGLPYIAQGDWCDPMNMVGPKGVGVSGWLAQALSFALQTWMRISMHINDSETLARYERIVDQLHSATEQWLWQGDWYARGITDDGVTFGVPSDREGRIFLNTQSWAWLANMPDSDKTQRMLKAIDNQLNTPYGMMLCAPAFTAMREDVGRVTQKWPGSGENGSIYNHAAAFYAASLYHIGEQDRAFEVLRKMIADPTDETFERRGQLPVYIPNYYRGAYHQFPESAGRSSHLFNTGTGAWFYRMVVEQLFGLKGTASGLFVDPHLPSDWAHAAVTRAFRGATFHVRYQKIKELEDARVELNGKVMPTNVINHIEAGQVYEVNVYFVS